MIKDVLDGLKAVSDGIKSVQAIVEAVKTGREYLGKNHPEVWSDMSALINELSRSVNVIKMASAVLTNFRFGIATDVMGSEMVRFNEYFIKSKTDAQQLEERIEDLRTHCSKIRKHAEIIGGSATREGFAQIFTFLGLRSPEREASLAKTLDQLAYEDFAVANTATEMLQCLNRALMDVQNALGAGGAMHPENVPAAATLLNEYGEMFEGMEQQAVEAAKQIRETVKHLQ